jgi:hypothetical protein
MDDEAKLRLILARVPELTPADLGDLDEALAMRMIEEIGVLSDRVVALSEAMAALLEPQGPPVGLTTSARGADGRCYERTSPFALIENIRRMQCHTDPASRATQRASQPAPRTS